MKALVISEDENFVKKCTTILESNNYDVITYKWLLKALDNIEEIRPNLIVVSSSEYPRHWKTLVQFVKSGIGGESIQIYLYEPTPLSKDEIEKANILGINGFFQEANDLTGLLSGDADEIPCVDNIIPKEQEPFETTESEEKIDVSDISEMTETGTGHVLISNPENNTFMTGKVDSICANTLNCVLDFNTNLKPDTFLQKVSYIWNGEIKSFEAIINDISGKNISIKVQKYYEEI